MMDYKKMDIEDIISWCTENDQIEWLKKTAAKKVENKIYPKKKEIALDANGKPKLTKKGKVKFTYVADKSQEPIIKKEPISFIELKYEFAKKFMPEILPKKKEEKQTMYDRIKSL